MDNPYKADKRAADTLGLVGEGRLQFRLNGDGTVAPFNRRWRTVGGHVGWYAALLDNAHRFLDAGLIDYVRPAGTAVDEIDPQRQVMSWSPVFLTRAGKYLLKLWCQEPFRVVEATEMPERLRAANRALAQRYVTESGLAEDDPARYEKGLRPHTEAVAAELLDVWNLNTLEW